MELELIKERDMPLLSRKRYSFYLTFKGSTPTRKEVRDVIAKKMKSEPELTVVKHIYTRYGISKAKVIAHVYSDKKDMERFEDKDLIAKHAEKKTEGEGKPAEEVKEDAPPEKPEEKVEEKEDKEGEKKE